MTWWARNKHWIWVYPAAIVVGLILAYGACLLLGVGPLPFWHY